MPRTCETCGHAEQPDHPLTALRELGFGEMHTDHAIFLCKTCMNRRKAASWQPDEPENKSLLEALARRHAPPQDHYTYLQDPQDAIHLMRLRPGWVDRHAVEHIVEP